MDKALAPLPQGQRGGRPHDPPSCPTQVLTPAHLCPWEVPLGKAWGSRNLRRPQSGGGWGWGGQPLTVWPGDGGQWPAAHWGPQPRGIPGWQPDPEGSGQGPSRAANQMALMGRGPRGLP